MLQIQHLKKTYPGFSLDVDLEIKPGRIVGLIGANGAGKSTIFKSILGLIRPDGGDIRLLGKSPREMTVKDREQIGTVLSEAGFSGYLTTADVRKIMKAMYPSFAESIFAQKTRVPGLEPSKQIKDLSTGLKARLKVLCALSHRPKILLLDEPTAGLDVVARDEVYTMIRDYMAEDESRAVLISSHISADLEKLCDEFYMIDAGSLVLHESVDTLFSEYAVLKVTEEQYRQLDQTYLLRRIREPFGYTCLTSQRAFYLENAPGLTIERAGLDELITLMIKGEEIRGE